MTGALPEFLGRYRVLRLLGTGAQADVYEVEDPKLFNARRALKMLSDPSAFANRVLGAEARRLTEVSHPNLVTIQDFGRDEASGRVFYVMELFTGGSLASVRLPWQIGDEASVRPRIVLTPAQVCRCFDGLLAGLEHLHEVGIVHRDVKPANVALSADAFPRLGDLGIAVGPAEDSHLASLPIGTRHYMAPEQAAGQAATFSSDIFAVGLSLFEVFSGRTLHDCQPGEERSADLGEVRTDGSAVVARLVECVESGRELEIPRIEGLPENVRKVIETACRIAPSARFKSAGEMRRALAAAAPAARERRSWRLAAVLSGDIVDYSVRVGEGVESTARQLSAARHAITAVIESSGGRLCDFIGDAFLAEFSSTRAAFGCARAIQTASSSDPSMSAFTFRMGIDLGELLLDEDRLYGDAVIRAARLQTLAAPGAICLSDLARQQLGDTGELELEDLGLRDLKNLPGPERVHQTRGPS